MPPALRGGGWGRGRGGRDVAQRRLAVCGLRSGGIVSQRARAALALGALEMNRERERERERLFSTLVYHNQAVASDTAHVPSFIMAHLLAGAGGTFIHG